MKLKTKQEKKKINNFLKPILGSHIMLQPLDESTLKKKFYGVSVETVRDS